MTKADSSNFIERERLMYEIIGSISLSDAPIIFKGALITKLVLSENKFKAISRQTVDIDANWTSEPPRADYLVDIVNKALVNVSVDLYAKLIREYGDKKSAGIVIVDKRTDYPVVEMDISINKVQESKIYTYDELTIKGVLPSEILADKVSVLSTSKIFRRAKDIVDVYALTHCVEVSTTEIYASHERNARVLGDFTEFSNRTKDLNHAYQKLRGIDNKPEFEIIYQHVSKFVRPFMFEHKMNKIWIPENSEWNDNITQKSPEG